MSEHGIMKYSWCDNLTTDTGHCVALCCTDCVYVVLYFVALTVSCPQSREISTGQAGSEDGYMKLGVSQYQAVDKIVCLSKKVRNIIYTPALTPLCCHCHCRTVVHALEAPESLWIFGGSVYNNICRREWGEGGVKQQSKHILVLNL